MYQLKGSGSHDLGTSTPIVFCQRSMLPHRKDRTMAHVTYKIVEHDGGWAYKLGDVFSETFATHDAARRAAEAVAAEQRVSGATTGIQYQAADGSWHEEIAQGEDRPETDVEG
jgi:hypothetical protein